MLVLERIFLFAEPTALALVLVYAYSVFGQFGWHPKRVAATMGVVFGLSATAAMLNPIQIADGTIIDIRTLFIGVAAAFFGPIGGGVTLAMAGGVRLLIGGAGTLIGLAGMSVSCLMGLCWYFLVRPRVQNDNLAFLMLGGMMSSSILVGVALPAPVRGVFFTALAPLLMLANVGGAFLLGKLIAREKALFDETANLRTAAAFDPLTQLMNRRAAQTTYNAAPMHHRKSQGTAMLCIDVDHFKAINDKYGHLVGDRVLVEIAERMSRCLRPDDIFARMSGDEFVIVLHDLAEMEAEAVAARCQRSISVAPVNVNGVAIPISVSIGCAWHSSRPEFAAFRNAADQVLYRAKEAGRDRMAFENINQPPSASIAEGVAA